MRYMTIQELGDLQNLLELFKDERSQWVTETTTVGEIFAYIDYAFEEYDSQ